MKNASELAQAEMQSDDHPAYIHGIEQKLSAAHAENAKLRAALQNARIAICTAAVIDGPVNRSILTEGTCKMIDAALGFPAKND